MGSTGSHGGASLLWENEVPRWSSGSIDESKVHGFEDEVTSLQRVILGRGNDDAFKAIGVFGVAGIGKTTLCQVLFNRREVKDYFRPRMWLCMSRNHEDDKDDKKVAILKRMLLYLGVREKTIEDVYEEQNVKGLLCALHLQLHGKKYLIVFDDASDEDKWYEQLTKNSTREGNWDSLASGLPKGYGGAVIVTSRSEEIAKMMVGKEVLRCVLPLSDPDFCWSIFRDAAKQKFHPSDEQTLKKEIFEKCAGHPFTAKLIGQVFHAEQPTKEGAQQLTGSSST